MDDGTDERGVEPPAIGDRARREVNKRQIRIVVNGRDCEVPAGVIGQAALVRLAFPLVPRGGARSLTVAFTRGPASRPEGFVAPGETVEVTEDQDFVVVVADQS